MTRIAATSRREKVVIFKPKPPSFYTTEFSYMNSFPQNIDQIFDFWVGQSLKLRRNACFRGFKFSLAVKFHVKKTWKVGSLKNVNFNFLSFKRCPYDNDFWPISLGDLNKILGVWNGFSGNCREGCDQLFF